MTRSQERFARRYDRLERYAERRWLGSLREQLLGEATGVVIDVGAGAGANLDHLRRAGRIIAVEPSGPMRVRLIARAARTAVPVSVLAGRAEQLPLRDNVADTVVFTLVLCSVTDPARALTEARRVLRPAGSLVFLEHVRGTGVAGWAQDRIAGLWSRIGEGCEPNRRTAAAIPAAGYRIDRMQLIKPWPRVPLIAPFVAGSATPTRQ